MADGNYGERVIDIDLAVTGARTLRNSALSQYVKVSSIVISGVAAATSTPIVLRHGSLSGPIVFYYQAPTAAPFPFFESASFGVGEFLCNGLYLNDITVAYTSGHLLIYTR